LAVVYHKLPVYRVIGFCDKRDIQSYGPVEGLIITGKQYSYYAKGTHRGKRGLRFYSLKCTSVDFGAFATG